MKFKTWGENNDKTIILLHGGGLSWWSYREIIPALREKHRVTAAVINGHGENHDNDFISIEDSAAQLIAYIDGECGGSIYAVAGLSIGAQIAVEALSQRAGIAKYAIIESASVCPVKYLNSLTTILIKISYPLVGKRWFSKLQAKALSLPDNMWEQYYHDSLNISRDTLVSMSLSNQNYRAKSSLSGTQAKVLIIVGEKENRTIRKSADLLVDITGGRLHIAEKMKHGEFSLAHPAAYVKLALSFMNDAD